ncbi:hypothetical protein SAMN05421738_109143 [Algoriella xinjiangensis]|uniref:Uncharacterized protein n=1 Tax=Algoriella xinjiangensis TaxID=684065 RepID=A0A1I4XSS2_9FLAO|nr:hypothetical protein [Algoriella xinjiangensis]SFN28463.1 hypothetical protein SAMN05421738_109143 [Algoriella xinjiangensis]
MNQFGIIIQETTSGLNTQYISPDLDRNNSEVIQTTQDERILATQLVNQSKFYSVEVTKSYKIYTYVNPNVTDEFGRSGYYAIKLYFHNKFVNPINLISLFNKIEAKYLEHKNNNTLAGQDYTVIQSLLEGKEVKPFLYLTEKKQFVTYFDPNNSTALTEKLNDEKVFTIEKLYAFDVAKSLAEDQVKAYGLDSFNDYKIKKANFDNSDRILREITQNNQPIDFRIVGKENFKIIYPSSLAGTLKYSTTEKKNISVADFNELRKPNVIPQPTLSRSTQPKKDNTPIIIVAIIGILALGVGGYFSYDLIFPKHKENEPIDSLGKIENRESIDNVSMYVPEIKRFLANKFVVNKQKTDSVEVKNDYYQIDDKQTLMLESYYFKNKDDNSVEYYSSFENLKSKTNKQILNKESLNKFLGDISTDTINWNKIVVEGKKQGLILPYNEKVTVDSEKDKTSADNNVNSTNKRDEVTSPQPKNGNTTEPNKEVSQPKVEGKPNPEKSTKLVKPVVNKGGLEVNSSL